MVTYTVKYKKDGLLFSRKIRNVIGDGFVFNNILGHYGQSFNIRFFTLLDGTRIEIPTADTTFSFDKDRLNSINENLRKEAGKIWG